MQTNASEIVETRRLIDSLFGSQLGAARQLHFSDRAVRWWCQFGAPPHIMAVLNRYEAGEISLTWARKLMVRRKRRPSAPATGSDGRRSNNSRRPG